MKSEKERNRNRSREAQLQGVKDHAKQVKKGAQKHGIKFWERVNRYLGWFGGPGCRGDPAGTITRSKWGVENTFLGVKKAFFPDIKSGISALLGFTSQESVLTALKHKQHTTTFCNNFSK